VNPALSSFDLFSNMILLACDTSVPSIRARTHSRGGSDWTRPEMAVDSSGHRITTESGNIAFEAFPRSRRVPVNPPAAAALGLGRSQILRIRLAAGGDHQVSNTTIPSTSIPRSENSPAFHVQVRSQQANVFRSESFQICMLTCMISANNTKAHCLVRSNAAAEQKKVRLRRNRAEPKSGLQYPTAWKAAV
jgi:hypothetical protein